MSATGTTKALIVQPLNYLYDHTYVFSAASLHPSRFAVVALANLALAPAATISQIRSLVSLGAVGIRVNPGLAPDGLASPSLSAALDEAAALGIPAALFVKGLVGVGSVAAAHSTTKIIIDHFGVPFLDKESRDAELRQLLDIGRKTKNVYVKASAFFRVSDRAFPYEDRCATVVSLVEALGAERVMFGTDFPYVEEECGYEKAWEILRQHVPISEDDKYMVGGGTAAELYGLDVKG